MHTNLSKRLLAGLMSVVMVLSLIAVAPTTEAKAETETLTIDLGSLDLNAISGGTVGKTFTAKDLAQEFADNFSFTTLNGDFEEPEITVSDSTGELDNDDKIAFGTAYTVNMKFTEEEKGAAAKVKKIKIAYLNEKNDDDYKTASKVSGTDSFSFSYKFKPAAGTVSTECVGYAGYGMSTIKGNIKKEKRVSLISDSAVKASAKWYVEKKDKDIADACNIDTTKGKVTVDSDVAGSFTSFENSKDYLLAVTLTAGSGFQFDEATAKAGADIAETKGYGAALLKVLNIRNGVVYEDGVVKDTEANHAKEYTFVGYAADTKNLDDITLYFTVKAQANRAAIVEATTWAPKYQVALNKEGYTTISSLASVAGLEKTYSVKDENGSTVKFDLDWRVVTGTVETGKNRELNPNGTVKTHGDVLTTSGDSILDRGSSLKLYPEAGDTLVLAPVLVETKSAKFDNYDFSALGLGTAGAAITLEPVEIKFTAAGEALKTLNTPKVTWKDSAKKWKATSLSGATIHVNGLGGDLESGVFSAELDYETYVEGAYHFYATIDTSFGAKQDTVNKYIKDEDHPTQSTPSGTYHVLYSPSGVNQTIKDGDVDFEVEGNPVVGLGFRHEDAVPTIEGDSSDDNGIDNGLWYDINPGLAHDCYTGAYSIVETGKTYALDMYYFLGRAEDEIGDAIPSGWKAYLNGDEVSYKTGYAAYGSALWAASGHYGYYILVTKTFEKTTTEIASADGEKTLYVNAPAPTVGQDVTNANITVSNSTSKYVTVGDVKWADEDGNAVTGRIEAEKAYTATVTLTAKDGFRFGEDETEKIVLGDNEDKGFAFIEGVEKDEDANTVTLTYAYEAEKIEYAEVKNASDATIKLEAGASYEDIMNALDDVKTTINFVNGGTVEAETIADTDKGAFATQWDKLGYVNTYVEGSDKTQTLTFYGAVDLSTYENDNFSYDDEATFVITVKVGAGTTLTIDANGGNITVPTSYEVEKDAVLSSAYTYVAGTITKAGYNFAGFYDAAEGGNRVYLSSTKIDKDTTIYAHWTKVFTGWTKNVKAASYSAGRLTVSWDVPVTGAAGYQVRIATSSDMSNATVVGGFNKTVKYYTALKTGTRYYVQVRAYRNDSTGARVFSAWSTTTSAVVK